MRVIVAAVPGKLHPRTVPAILEAGYDVDVINVGRDDQAYYDVIRHAWRAGESFCTVEHDIEVSPGMLDELRDCWAPWCAHSYRIYWGNLMDTYPGAAGLGLTRFSWQLIQKHPGLLTVDVPAKSYENGRDGRFWMNLDSSISDWLKGPYREIVHRHIPDVTHHHAYNYEGAYLPPAVIDSLPQGDPRASLPTAPPQEIGSPA